MSEVSRVERVQIAGTLLAGDDDWVVSTRSDSRDGARVLESASQERVLLYLAARVWLEGAKDEEPCFYLVPLTTIVNGERPLEEEVETWVSARLDVSWVSGGKARLDRSFLYQGRCGCRPSGEDTHMKVEHSQECIGAQRKTSKKESGKNGC